VPKWTVRYERTFAREFARLDEDVREQLIAHADVLEVYGPSLGRPLVDTLRDSAYPNMKELRFNTANGVWRVAFAFDPESRAVLLLAGDKSGLRGRAEKTFYEALIQTADLRFKAYLERLAKPPKPRSRG